MKIAMRGVRLPFTEDAQYAVKKAINKAKAAGVSVKSGEIFKKSVDARKRDEIMFEYTVTVETESSVSEDILKKLNSAVIVDDTVNAEYGSEECENGVVVCGFGPCGMFCALLLAENGYKPTVIERGGDVYSRARAVDEFYKTGVLDKNNNIQFGAGGAGTFSDGKLITRINDSRCHYVLSRFHDFGAPDDILINAKPHIGTDRLRTVVDGIAKRIEELGGRVLYNTSLIEIVKKGNKVTQVKTNGGEIPCSALVLAIGHSARDSYGALEKIGAELMCKPFSVGVRIEHLQSDINRALYGAYAGDPHLPIGEYSLSKRQGERGVYTFCMCPGGSVVAAASEDGGVVTNGMSEYARDGRNANSAVAVSVLPSDFGCDFHGAVDFVRGIERRAYTAGGGAFRAPVQTVGDFLSEKRGSEPKRIMPSYMNGNVALSDMNTVLPPFVCDMLKMGIKSFDSRLPGFACADSVLTGAETRTSSPIRIPRDDNGLAFSFDNLYPAGEGAGYAGGITSAAVDGIDCALKIMKRYKN